MTVLQIINKRSTLIAEHTLYRTELHPGDAVLVKSDGDEGWKQPAEVVQQCAPQSYIVQIGGGGELRCNHKHLRLGPADDPAAGSEQRPDYVENQQAQSTGPLPQLQASEQIQLQPSREQPVQTSGQPPIPYYTRSGRAVVKPTRFQ